MVPSELRAQLLHQHQDIRALADKCQAMAAGLADLDALPMDLTREVARLRFAVMAHNQLEDSILKPALLGADAFGDVRVSQMAEQHIAEHDALRGKLEQVTAGQLRDTVASLRAHMDHEERTFLSPRVLRDDIVSIEPGA